MPTDTTANPFADWTIIHTYTRAEAIDDGVLFDVTGTALEAGFKIPVAITARVMGEVVATPGFAARHGETDKSRLWDVLWMTHVAIKTQRPNVEPDRLNFDVIATDCQGRKITHQLWAHCGPGDHMEPVLTIMMQGED